MDRRRFLTMVGASGAAAVASGCRSGGDERLIPYLIPIEDVSPGVSALYATVCRECPAGCGMVARVRDGRAYKVEGNPEHPTGRGALCLRGQTALQNLYNPDRIRGPLLRDAFGRLQPIGWEEAQRAFLDVLRVTRAARAAWIGSLSTGPLDELVERWLDAVAPDHTRLRYEPFAYEALRVAGQRLFGVSAVPDLQIEAAHMLLSFGAEFLETWVSNVEYARAFATWRAKRLKPGFAARYVFVGPRRSLTGANADEWIAVRPGAEVYVARALAAVLSGAPAGAEAPLPVGALAEAAGVSAEKIARLAREFASPAPSLAFPMGTAENGDEAVIANEAILRLNRVAGNVGRTYFPERAHALSETAPTAELLDLIGRLHAGEVSTLFIHHANPVYHLPPESRCAQAIARVPNIISFSSYLDETTALATLVLPDHTPYESWGSYSPRPGVTGLLQPVVPPVFDTRQTSDLLLASAAQLGHTLGAADSREYLRRGLGLDDPAWSGALERGGVFGEGGSERRFSVVSSQFSVNGKDGQAVDLNREPRTENREPATDHRLSLVLAPSLRFFDGRAANRPLAQEIPDPMTHVVWGSWAEIHPATAERLGAAQGDLLRLVTEQGELQVPAYVTPHVHPDAIAIELGQGHTSYTRYGTGVGVNPLALLGALPARLSGGVLASGVPVAVSRLPARRPIVVLQASREQPGEPVARQIALAEYHALPAGDPLKPHEEKRPTFYRFRPPGEHQWGMTIDLDRCTGCSACVAACYVENNVPTVGREECARGREMAWLRIESYEPPSEAALGSANDQRRTTNDERRTTNDTSDVSVVGRSSLVVGRSSLVVFLPMLCQHCDNAPCEYVCPVYATVHSNDGLNQQVYSRCVGTRYCSNNCPYKVRRFNWRTYEFPYPLDQALNPDVVHRTKGVMEKCTFCIQRIRAGRITARAQRRPIADGEIETACAQSCPTGAILFGDLKDPGSRARAAGADPRGYGVLAELKTYPNITYLARVHAEESEALGLWRRPPPAPAGAGDPPAAVPKSVPLPVESGPTR